MARHRYNFTRRGPNPYELASRGHCGRPRANVRASTTPLLENGDAHAAVVVGAVASADRRDDALTRRRVRTARRDREAAPTRVVEVVPFAVLVRRTRLSVTPKLARIDQPTRSASGRRAGGSRGLLRFGRRIVRRTDSCRRCCRRRRVALRRRDIGPAVGPFDRLARACCEDDRRAAYNPPHGSSHLQRPRSRRSRGRMAGASDDLAHGHLTAHLRRRKVTPRTTSTRSPRGSRRACHSAARGGGGRRVRASLRASRLRGSSRR